MANELNIQPAPNWGGVPYAQGTTFGQPLSPYANLVDQIYAASQPMPTGMQFGRWAFGGGGGQTIPGQGQTQGQMPMTPPSGVGPQQVGGLLGGQQAQPLTQSFGPYRPISGAVPSGVQLSGDSPFYAAFNQLMQTDPNKAYQYLFQNFGADGANARGFGGYGGAGQQLEQQLGSDAYHQLANKYGAYRGQSFPGLPGANDARMAELRPQIDALTSAFKTAGLLGGR